MNSGLITIIIPAFNRAHLISNAIESVLSQTIKIWELFIIDDGSTDETYDVVNKYINDPRIVYKYKEHSGVSATRNFGAELAKGDYLIFLDSDDSLMPDLLENLKNNEFKKFDIICWNVLKFIDGKQKVLKPRPLGDFYNNIKATFLSGSICYKKEIFFNAGSYDPKLSFGENYELGIRISQLPNVKVLFIDKIFLHYRVMTNKRESNSLSNRLSSYIYQYKKHQALYTKNPKVKSEMNYLIGFVHEKSNKKREAFQYYKTSWMLNPWKIKPMLKILYLYLIK